MSILMHILASLHNVTVETYFIMLVECSYGGIKIRIFFYYCFIVILDHLGQC